MIKCDVKLCAVISRAAVVKESKDGGSFLSFSVKLPLSGRDGSAKELEISVSADGDKSKASVYAQGRRLSIAGTLSLRKKDGRVFYNLRASSAEITNSKNPDSIEGTMEFQGKVGTKGIEERQDKNGKTFKTFSAFSTDKDGDKAEFIWVRFLYFDPKEGEDFLATGKYINIKGALQLSVYRDEVNLDCRVSEVSEWVLDK